VTNDTAVLRGRRSLLHKRHRTHKQVKRSLG